MAVRPSERWTTLVHAGLTFTAAVLLGFFAGRWMDGKLHTQPLFTLLGVFWGLGGSFWYLVRKVRELEDKEKGKDSPP
ncbi:MAG: AtpZ/AtpI family protein [Calditrichaeota bacterium]|nr:AtpZ/AtpI family protein [Calditrichota bacterium]